MSWGAVLSRGVSPYVSTIILTILVLGFGSYLIAYAVSQFGAEEQALREQVQRMEMNARQSLDVLASFINGTQLVVYLATGSWPVSIDGIYVNGTLAASMCTCSVVGSNASCSEAPPYSVIYISCNLSPLSPSPRSATIEVVYGGGEVETHASSI
ncbi:MAG: hypothetical protein GXO32_07930 [Crenarchaeota archaeon]|nr:hypothetical protein [Thermoproteota archaeon]